MSQVRSSGADASGTSSIGVTLAERIIASSDLPVDVQGVVRATVRSTRLWPRERADVARELVAHFRDGLERGEAAADLVAKFGEPKAAGRRIGKAAREKRHWLWHAQKRVGQGVLVLVAGAAIAYGVLAVRFFSGSPTIARNYLAEINAPSLAIPESQRAWTVYRQAFIDIQPAYRAHEGWDSIEAPAPGTAEFARAKDAINAFTPHLDQIRAASAMQAIGYVLSDALDPDLYLATNPRAKPEDLTPASENPALYGVLLEPMQHMRRGARALALEARIAAAEGDGQRATDNIDAMLGLARHTFDMPFLIGDLVGVAIAQVAWGTTGDLIARHPEAFTDLQLGRLAQRIERDSGSNEFFADPKSETEFMDDTLQRMFTDDGNGDGRLTPEGMWYLAAINDNPFRDDKLPATSQLTGPAVMAFTAGRKEARQLYHAVLDNYVRYRNRPMWTWTKNPDQDALKIIDDSGTVFPMMKVLAPALGNTVLAGHWGRLTREAILTAIALEQFRRGEGHYPDALSELVPTYLKSVPLDLADGQPIRYRVVDGKPLIYSIGMDRVDNEGRPAMDGTTPIRIQEWRDAATAARMVADGFPNASKFDGDVVLWPRGD